MGGHAGALAAYKVMFYNGQKKTICHFPITAAVRGMACVCACAWGCGGLLRCALQTLPRLGKNNYVSFHAMDSTWSIRCAKPADAASFVQTLTVAAAHAALHGPEVPSASFRVMNRTELGAEGGQPLAPKDTAVVTVSRYRMSEGPDTRPSEITNTGNSIDGEVCGCGCGCDCVASTTHAVPAEHVRQVPCRQQQRAPSVCGGSRHDQGRSARVCLAALSEPGFPLVVSVCYARRVLACLLTL